MGNGRSSTASSCTAPIEEEPLLEYLCILQEGDSREARATGGSQMKTIAIRMPDVEAAMRVEVQKRNKAFKDLQQLLIKQIRQEYQKTSGGSCR